MLLLQCPVKFCYYSSALYWKNIFSTFLSWKKRFKNDTVGIVHLKYWFQNFKEITLEGANDVDMEANSGPTLKRLRLRGDWSDTGPQALPECEMRNQAGG